MDFLYQTALFIHIVCGGIALVAGIPALFARKWEQTHRVSGRIFYYSVLGVAFSAIGIAAWKSWYHLADNATFLLYIGLFTFYQVQVGYRSVRDKSLKPYPFDYFLGVLGLVNGSFMLASLNLVLMVFGAIQLSLALQDTYGWWVRFKGGKLPPMAWLRRHLGNMIGTYIAVFTAFLVVNSNGHWLIWLGPTMAFTPLLIYWNVRIGQGKPPVKKAKIKTAVATATLALMFSSQPGTAQPYVEGGNTRHRFAQLTLGASSTLRMGSSQYQTNDAGTSQPAVMGTEGNHRLLIGGTHFWGHADFYVAFPILSTGDRRQKGGIETGFRYLPWRIESGKLRPYVGFAHMVDRIAFGEGATVSRNRLPLQAGLYYLHGAHLFEAGWRQTFNNQWDYHFGTTALGSAQLPGGAFGLGYKWMFDTSLGAEKNWKSGRTAYLTDTLSKLGRLNSWTVGIGPSAAFFLPKAEYLNQQLPWIGQHAGGSMLELMLGYYHQPHDVQMSLVYRSMNSRISAFGNEQEINRRAISLEAYHFFADYHGFVPYIGAVLSADQWQVNTQLRPEISAAAFQYNGWLLSPGITAGWDIRPDELQRWYLRTSLRYFPGQRLSSGAGQMRVDQLEVNFIQLVIMPGRFR